MEHHSGSFASGDGLTLSTRTWWPDRDAWPRPKAAVVVSHGFGEHSGRYERFAEALTQRGYAVLAFDHRGHGRSEGPPATLRVFGAMVDDLGRFLDRLHEELALPRFLFGQSVGAVVAGHLGLIHPAKIEGLVLGSPFLRDHPDAAPEWMRRLSRPLARVLPDLPAVRIDPTVLSRDPAEVRAYQDDPLVFHGRLTVGTAAELLAGGAHLLDRAAALTPPLLLLHGADDRLADPDASIELFERAGSADKRFEEVEGGYHELHNDLDRDRVLERIGVWLDDHLPEPLESEVEPDEQDGRAWREGAPPAG